MNRNKFNRIVAKYHGDSLRDLIVAIEAHRGNAKFLGFGDSVTRSNLAKANQNRDYHFFEEFAYYMIEQARTLRVTKIFSLAGNICAFDSTTIELCLAVFCWAKFRGDSENAVRIQIYTAIISYCLVAIVHYQMKLDRTIYETLQILRISLTDTTPLQDLIFKLLPWAILLTT